MKQVLCLDKNDIKTSVIGLNIWVEVTPELSVSFTREALDELVADYKAIQDKEADQLISECNALKEKVTQCTKTMTTN